MKGLSTSIRGLLFTAIAAIGPVVSAQETPAAVVPGTDTETPAQTVQVTGVRDPVMLPYEKAFDTLTRINKVSDGKMDMLIRVVSAQTNQPLPDLEVGLQGNVNQEKLTLSPDGFLTVPLSQSRLDDKAVFVTNKKKGSLKVEYFFVPKLPKDSFRFGDIAASIAAANRAREEVMPWYLRLLSPSIKEVLICYPNDKNEISVFNGAAAERPAVDEQRSSLVKSIVYCARFNEDETVAARNSVVTPAPGWKALFN